MPSADSTTRQTGGRALWSVLRGLLVAVVGLAGLYAVTLPILFGLAWLADHSVVPLWEHVLLPLCYQILPRDPLGACLVGFVLGGFWMMWRVAGDRESLMTSADSTPSRTLG